MILASTSAAGVRHLSSVREGHGLRGSAREAGVGMETGYRWLRETYLRYRREGKTIAETGALLEFVSSRAAVWEADVGAATGTTFESTMRRR
jgi:transposase, IS30 family